MHTHRCITNFRRRRCKWRKPKVDLQKRRPVFWYNGDPIVKRADVDAGQEILCAILKWCHSKSLGLGFISHHIKWQMQWRGILAAYVVLEVTTCFLVASLLTWFWLGNPWASTSVFSHVRVSPKAGFHLPVSW